MPRARVILKEGDKIANCTYLREDGFQLTKKGLKNRVCVFLCECGKEFSTFIGNVQRGNTTSCGCMKKKMAGAHSITHGCSRVLNKSDTGYVCYFAMLRRCLNPNSQRFERYSKLGVCDRWKESFENFIEDMGVRPSLSHSLERKDNNLGYSKENCKWATKFEQANNKSTNKFVVYRRERKTFAQWCSILEIDYDCSYLRYTRGKKEFEYVVAAGIVDKLKNNRVTLKVA